MSYSTPAERDALYALVNEILPTIGQGIYPLYKRNRRGGMASSEGLLVAATRFALCEYFRGLELAGYRCSTVLAKVWDAWTPVRFVGNLDFLVTPGARGQRSEQIKLQMTGIGPSMIRIEVLRWRDGHQGCIYRVEGAYSTRDSAEMTWGLFHPFA